MARELNGAELVSFIKERQAKQVRMIRQAHKIIPRLIIPSCHPMPLVLVVSMFA